MTRLNLLNDIKCFEIRECMSKHSPWVIKDTILNTKWKYVSESYNPYNPIIDKTNDVEFSNIKQASMLTSISE